MNREIKFKAKLGNGKWDDVTNCFLDSHVIYHNKEGFDDFVVEIKHNTLCQLITKIDEIEVYEYDCWYNGGKIRYFYYEAGLLKFKVFNLKYEIIINNIVNSDDWVGEIVENCKFIGNWHDGEEHLLKQIVKLKNE